MPTFPELLVTQDNSATFTPSAALTADTDYTATITNAALDLSGNALAAGAVPNPWSFTTGAGPDATAPTITLTSPASAAMAVPLNAVVSATFSKDMDPLTITAPGTFTVAVAGAGGAAVTGTVTYDAVNDIATFTPAANLTPSTQYTATVSNAATDLAGNALVAGVVPNPWTFTTGLVAGTVGPNLGTASTFGFYWRRRGHNQSGYQHGHQRRHRNHRSFNAGDRIP